MQYFGIPTCPYCKKHVNLVRTWRLKREGEYKCPRCGGISNIYLSPLVYVFAVLARHFDQCMRCIRHGYHVLLEKPIATTVQQCHTLAEAAAEAGVLVNVCYVLRYHPMFQKVRQLVREGQLGRIMSINYTNSIGLDRTLHTYVRGLDRKSVV